MKVIHIDSGLGNQMLSYCEYLAMRQANPSDDIYLENIIYDIPECDSVTCQWNGYELGRVFGIETPPNIRTVIEDSDWDNLMRSIRESRFWERNMNYPVHFVRAFSEIGIDLENTFGDFEAPEIMALHHPDMNSVKYKMKEALRRSMPYMLLKRFRYADLARMRAVVPGTPDVLFPTTDENLFAGQKLLFKLRGYGLEKIEDEVRKAFVFPSITDARNAETFDHMNSVNSVAIHARRGDMLGYNYIYYATGYFKRAVRYIKKHVEDPEFFIFCDPGSIEWAKRESAILGLDIRKDKISFVDWNSGQDSFRDMQLMSACHHQVITNSSFGWWASWLNTHDDKITCAPAYDIISTHTF